MPNIDLGGIYSQMILDMSDFLRASRQADQLIQSLQKQLDGLSKNARAAARSFDALATSMGRAFRQTPGAGVPAPSPPPSPPPDARTWAAPVILPTLLAMPPAMPPQRLLPPGQAPVALPSRLLAGPPVPPQKLLPPGQAPVAIPMRLLPPAPGQMQQWIPTLPAIPLRTTFTPPPGATSWMGTFRASVASAGQATATFFAGIGRGLSTSLTNFATWGTSVTTSIGATMTRLFSFRNMLLGLGALSLFGNITTAIASFDQGMARVRAIAQEEGGFTEQAFGRMRAAILKLGALTIYGPTQVAEAFGELMRGGQSAEAALATLTTTLQMASIESIDLATASKIVLNSLSQFSLDATKATYVTDSLTKASALSQTTLLKLGTAMSMMGPNASMLGMQFHETAAAVALLAKNGIDGTRAGTGFRAMLTALMNDTPRHRAAAASLGVSWDQMNPAKVGLVAAIERLKTAKIDLSHAMQLTTAAAGPSLLTFVQYIDLYKQWIPQMEQAEGITNRMATVATNNLKDAFTRLTHATDALWIKLGDTGLTGSLRTLTDLMTNTILVLGGFISPLAPGATAAYQMAEALKAIAVAAAAIAAVAIVGFLGFLLGGGIGLGAIAVGLIAITAAMAAMGGEAQRFAAIEEEATQLVSDMGAVAETTSQTVIDGLKTQAGAVIKAMEAEMVRMQNIQVTASWYDTLTTSVINYGKTALSVFGALTGLGDVVTLPEPGDNAQTAAEKQQADRLAMMQANVDKLKASLATIGTVKGKPAPITPPPYKSDIEPFERPDKASGRAAANEAKQAAREALQGKVEAMRAELDLNRQLNTLDEARNAQVIEQTRLGHDIVALALAEAEAKDHALEMQMMVTQLERIRLQDLLATGAVIDASDKKRYEGDIASLNIKNQQLVVERETALLKSEAVLQEATYRQAQQQLTTAQTRSEDQYGHAIDIARLTQKDALATMIAGGMTREAQQEQEIRNLMDLNTKEQLRLVLRRAYAQAALDEAIAADRPPAEITTKELDVEQVARALEISIAEAQDLINRLKQAPTTLATIASQAVNDIFGAFMTGISSMGDASAQRAGINRDLARNSASIAAAQAAYDIAAARLANVRRTGGDPTQVKEWQLDFSQASAQLQTLKAESVGLKDELNNIPTLLEKLAAGLSSVFKSIGQQLIKPFIDSMGTQIQTLVSGLTKGWSQGTQNLIGAGIGIAMLGIGALLDSQKAQVESLGDSVKDNITEVEQQRGLIAGEREIAIATLSTQLGVAFQPTNMILRDIAGVMRGIASKLGAVAMTPALAADLYGRELLGSVRLG